MVIPLYLEFENKSVQRVANAVMHGSSSFEGTVRLGKLGTLTPTHLVLNYNHDVLCAD